MLFEIRDGSVSFREKTVLSHINFHIRGNEKIALVGRNGAGKTTLLHLVAGSQELDSTEKTPGAGIFWSRACKVEMLEQNPVKNPDITVEELCQCHGGKVDPEQDSDGSIEGWRKEHQESNEESFKVSFDRLFTKLGFSLRDKQKRIGAFSGGEQMKIMLAFSILRQADVWLLDEPTNHLDLETTEWLEEALRQYPGAVVLVSHDRYFMDQVAQVTWEVSAHEVSEYAGNYSFYRQEKVRRFDKQQKAYEAQQQEIDRLNQLIEKFKHKPRKASFARSREKILERMERIPAPVPDDALIHTGDILPRRPGSKTVLDCDHLVIGYDRPIREISLRIRRGQKIGIFGPNGSGKTTFIKTVAGIVPPWGVSMDDASDGTIMNQTWDKTAMQITHNGEDDAFASTITNPLRREPAGRLPYIKEDNDTNSVFVPRNWDSMHFGENIDIGYFDQQAAQIESSANVFDWFHKRFPDMTGEEEHKYLAGFLFRGEDFGKTVSSLSGGEKARLVLASLLAQKPNFLLLDEPTNNMDIPAKETLESIFRDYRGTILFISHDRYFLSKVAESLLIFEENDKPAQHPAGNRDTVQPSAALPDSEPFTRKIDIPDALYFPSGYDRWKERQNRIARGEDVSITRQAQEQRLLESFRAVPQKEKHERPLSDRQANLDWRFRLNEEERLPAEYAYQQADEALSQVAAQIEEEANSRKKDEAKRILDRWEELKIEDTQRAQKACAAWTKTLLDWYDIWLEAHEHK